MRRPVTHPLATQDPHGNLERVAKLQAIFDQYFAEGRLPAAIDVARALLEVLASMGDPIGLAAAEVGLGAALLACGRRQEAWPSFRRARALLHAHGTPADFATAYSNLGSALGRMGRLVLAKAAFIHSIAWSEERDLEKDFRHCQVLLAHTLLHLGEIKAAARINREAALDLDLLIPSDRITLHETEAEVCLAEGAHGLAEEAFSRKFIAALEIGHLPFMADSLYRLALLNYRKGDTWAVRYFLSEAQECIAGQGYWEAEARIQGLLTESRLSRVRRKPRRLPEPPAFRRCS